MQRELDRAKYVVTRGQVFDALVEQYGEFAVPQAYIDAESDRLAKQLKAQMRQYGMKKLPDTFKKDERFKDEAKRSFRRYRS